VNLWNDALDRHDVTALAELYGEQVRFYGRDTPRRAVIAAKTQALGPKSTYHQEIVGAIELHPAGDVDEASFTKRSGSNGKTSDVAAKLSLRRAPNGKLVIVEETDAPSEARRAARSRDACEEAAAKAANDLPAVKKMMDDATRETEKSGGRARLGGVGPIDHDDGFSVSLGVHTEERFVSMVWYSVDRDGQLTVRVYGIEERVPEAALRKVEAACKR
jgi:hypothetical protein